MSTEHDLLIRGGDAVLPGRGRTPCDIAIRDGRIAAILAPGAPASAAATLDARGLVVLPGAIDVHLHLGHGRESPGRGCRRTPRRRARRPSSAGSPASSPT